MAHTSQAVNYSGTNVAKRSPPRFDADPAICQLIPNRDLDRCCACRPNGNGTAAVWHFRAGASGLAGQANLQPYIFLAISDLALCRQSLACYHAVDDGGRSPPDATKTLARGLSARVMMAICMFFFFGGAPFLSVAQMAAGLYTYPLFVSLLAGPVLGEYVGIWRITALAIGGAGAFLMLDPFAASFTPVQLLPIAAGFFYACNILILRRYCRHETPLALTGAVAILFFLCGLLGIVFLTALPFSPAVTTAFPFVSVGWPELTGFVLLLAFGCSVLNLSGNICLARAYQTADSSWLAPLDFIYLLFAATWGRLLFDHWPAPQAIGGMTLIALAGMLTAWREQRQQRQG